MRLKELRDAYYDKSGQASDVARKLGFAGVAIVWVFREMGSGPPRLGGDLLAAAFLIVAALAADFLQYVYGALAWGIFHRQKELENQRRIASRLPPLGDIGAPKEINWPSVAFFWAKIVGIAIAYIVLLKHLARQFFG